MCDVIVDDPKKFYTNKNKNQTQRNKLLYEYNKTFILIRQSFELFCFTY